MGAGREKALASAGHVSTLHPEILGVINYRVIIIKSAKIEIAEKMSVLFDLDLLLNVETLRRFVQLKPFQAKCFEYLLKCKDIVAVLPAGVYI